MEVKIKIKGDLTIISYTEDCTGVEPIKEGEIRFTGFESIFGKKSVTKKVTEYVFKDYTLLYVSKKYD